MGVLTDIAKQLGRIADALERAAPPILPALPPAKPATLRDLKTPSPTALTDIYAALDEGAVDLGLLPRSSAAEDHIRNYEKLILYDYGINSVYELPWNKAAGKERLVYWKNKEALQTASREAFGQPEAETQTGQPASPGTSNQQNP